MIYIGVHATLWPGVAPRERGPRSMRELLRALADVLPFALLIAGTLGGIYVGIVTTTEGATIGCMLAIVLGALCGDLTPRGFVEAIVQHDQVFRQHPVHHLHRLHLLLRDQLRRHRREGHASSSSACI